MRQCVAAVEGIVEPVPSVKKGVIWWMTPDQDVSAGAVGWCLEACSEVENTYVTFCSSAATWPADRQREKLADYHC